jgi:hypothetical protein
MNHAQQPIREHVKPPLFLLGQIVATPGALAIFQQHEDKSIHQYLQNHQRGDWGALCTEDKQSNDYAVNNGGRILSAYLIGHHKIWIITEADNSVTTILLPSEY